MGFLLPFLHKSLATVQIHLLKCILQDDGMFLLRTRVLFVCLKNSFSLPLLGESLGEHSNCISYDTKNTHRCTLGVFLLVWTKPGYSAWAWLPVSQLLPTSGPAVHPRRCGVTSPRPGWPHGITADSRRSTQNNKELRAPWRAEPQASLLKSYCTNHLGQMQRRL